jgi:hypothetical protein
MVQEHNLVYLFFKSQPQILIICKPNYRSKQSIVAHANIQRSKKEPTQQIQGSMDDRASDARITEKRAGKEGSLPAEGLGDSLGLRRRKEKDVVKESESRIVSEGRQQWACGGSIKQKVTIDRNKT